MGHVAGAAHVVLVGRPLRAGRAPARLQQLPLHALAVQDVLQAARARSALSRAQARPAAPGPACWRSWQARMRLRDRTTPGRAR